jgi:prevent-host-death family protein
MRFVGIRELRQNPAEAVGAAASGTVVVVTDRGTPVAQLVPVASTWRDRMAAAGRLHPAVADGATLKPPLRQSTTGGTPLGDVLGHMREDER